MRISYKESIYHEIKTCRDSDGIERSFTWTTTKYAWPRRLKIDALEGSLRRWNPITKKPYMFNCWNGYFSREIFCKPSEADRIVPSNFLDLIKNPNQNNDATFKGRILSRFDVPGPSTMEHSVGEDADAERPFWDGEPVDWEYLAGSSLENVAWRTKVQGILQGMIAGVENFNEANPQARKRKVDPMEMSS